MGLVRLNSRTHSPLSSATHVLELVLLLCLGELSPAGPCHDRSIMDSVRYCMDLRTMSEVVPEQDRGPRNVSLINARWLTRLATRHLTIFVYALTPKACGDIFH